MTRIVINRWGHRIDLDAAPNPENDEAQCERCLTITDRDDMFRLESDEWVCVLCGIADDDLVAEAGDPTREEALAMQISPDYQPIFAREVLERPDA